MTKSKTPPICVLCGGIVALECGFMRCQVASCRHTQNQSYAFKETPTYSGQRYKPYEPVIPKPVDEEFE